MLTQQTTKSHSRLRSRFVEVFQLLSHSSLQLHLLRASRKSLFLLSLKQVPCAVVSLAEAAALLLGACWLVAAAWRGANASTLKVAWNWS